ncbi:unnamed protein product [Periconia digitata]|uniref:B-block binding subunit of TFIIIC n=1 Tax=Periconia digitata TaxID=1303443 RepID=A0A9W4XWK2_9PLEO|nr:unnamed protein product [Periconia digitata]
MATGLDGLLHFLLSEIALCGVQGADSADFYRFIDAYRQNDAPIESQSDTSAKATTRPSPKPYSRKFYESSWCWVTTHPDIHVFDGDKTYRLSLSEFESLERQTDTSSHDQSPVARETERLEQLTPRPTSLQATPSNSLLSLGNSLRAQLVAEGSFAGWSSTSTTKEHQSDQISLFNHVEGEHERRSARNIPDPVNFTEPVFDDLSSPIKCPRVFASQDRVWQAVTGHSIDLKRVPSMEFLLLCVIATRGAGGITQPDLVRITGQDKRSVPKRTDELAKKGYIDKRPIQDGSLRTSLCVHKKFVQAGSVLTKSYSVDDVFGANTFDFSGFVCLLHELLTTTPLVPIRELRIKLGVPIQQWYKRSVRSSIDRLEASEYIKRVKAPRKGSGRLLVCIKALREPTEDDIQNLRFKRGVHEPQQEADELLEEDIEGETFMRDLELDMMEETDHVVDNHVGDGSRIAPQWTPDRLLANIVFDATESFGIDGDDTSKIRDLTTGKFWKRPIESFISRVSDDWEESQPRHLRHLAIVKDTMVTNDKKYAHFLYRTHANFQKVADAGEVDWINVSKEAREGRRLPGKEQTTGTYLDPWGFAPVNMAQLHRRSGTSDLSECRQSVVHVRSAGQRWEKVLFEELALEEPDTLANTWVFDRVENGQTAARNTGARSTPKYKTKPKGSSRTSTGRSVKTAQKTLLNREQRQALGLPKNGRLGAEIEKLIRDHRRKTGDPTSIPEIIPTADSRATHSTPEQRETRELSKAEGVSNTPQGTPVNKRRKPIDNGIKGPLLTPDQRRAKGLAPHGRLPEKIVAELRRLAAAGLDPFSIVLPLPDDNLVETNPTRQSDHHADNISSAHDQILEASPPEESSEAICSQTSPRLSTDAHATAMNVPHKRTLDELNAEQSSPLKRLRPDPPIPHDDVGHVGSPTSILPIASGFEPPKRKLGGAHEVPSTPRKKRRTSADSSVPSVSKNNKQTSGSQPDEKMVDRNQLHIALPGVYFDADATRSVGRGRPRKAFMMIIKTAGLQKYTWFKHEPRFASPVRFRASNWKGHMWPKPQDYTQTSGTLFREDLEPGKNHYKTSEKLDRDPCADATLQNHHSLKAGAESSQQLTPPLSVLSPVPTRDTASIGDLSEPMDDVSSAQPQVSQEKSQDHLPQSLEVASPQLQPRDAEKPPGFVIGEILVQQTCTPVEPQIDRQMRGSPEQFQQPRQQTVPSEQSRKESSIATPDSERTTADAQKGVPPDVLHRMHDIQQSRVSPAGWVAINMPNPNPSREYQSPYASTPVQPMLAESACDQPPELVEQVGTQLLENTQSSTNVRAAFADPRLDDPNSKFSRRKRGEDRNVVLGRGNVHNSRTSVVRYILELCNGVFPLNGEIAHVYKEVWKERGPKKMACPERSTIIRTLNDMINDPTQKLKRYTFVHEYGTGTIAKRALVAYSNLAVTSPKVIKVVQEIRAAYPYKYFPSEVSHLVGDLQKPRPVPIVQLDDGIVPEDTSEATKSLARRVRRSNKAREKAEKQQVAKAYQLRNLMPNQTQSRVEGEQSKNLHPQRMRLVGLNAPGRAKSDALASQKAFEWPQVGSSSSGALVDTEPLASNPERPPEVRTVSGPLSDHESTSDSDDEVEDNAENAEDAAVADDAEGGMDDDENPDVDREPEEHGHGLVSNQPAEQILASDTNHIHEHLTKPDVRFYPSNGTFSTIFSIPTNEGDRSNSKTRLKRAPARSSKNLRKAKLKAPKSLHQDESGPTLVERLTGLTGNVNEPDYRPPSKKIITTYTWPERKERRKRREMREAQAKDKKYPENPDPVLRFKKVFITLVVASCMSGKEGTVNWDIVVKVLNRPRFDLEKTKETWRWIQKNMTGQLHSVTENFESTFLKAYEEGNVASIEDPETYDWANLVRWAMLHCRYPLPSLPQERENLKDYQIDISNYQLFDRSSWYRNDTAALVRSHKILGYGFAAPLHVTREQKDPKEDKSLKARSWIRANISTPKTLYDKKIAHEKLRPLGESVLNGAVQELVEARLLRMWKIKRLRPGRNYEFSAGFAMKYRRVFELRDFMAAVQLKKELDSAFASNRKFTLSRTAEDGAVMAILSLASDGRIKLIPILPPIDNELDAPRPRISVWGFSAGDYVHRAIDRNSLFWEVQVVATDSYIYGNPLSSRPVMPDPGDASTSWGSLPEPPMPDPNDPNALFPIWSTIDGQHVIYPWWNRILNMVLQSLMFQPSATPGYILNHCPEHTTELFEVQLVLDWLEKVFAVTKSAYGTYEVNGNFWAAFGDKLIDEETDEFGQHVKRKGKVKQVDEPTWRSEYNKRFSALQKITASALQQGNGDASSDDEDGSQSSENEDQSLLLQRIVNKPKSQYTTVKRALHKSQQSAETQAAVDGDVVMTDAPAVIKHGSTAQTRETVLTQGGDPVEDFSNPKRVRFSLDAEQGAQQEEEEDIDAEGESDDDYTLEG